MPHLLKAMPIALGGPGVHETTTSPPLHRTPRWPDAGHILAARGASGASAWLKTWWRQQWCRPHRSELLQALTERPHWAARFERDARYFHCVSSHFIDRRHGPAQRIRTMAHDLRRAGSAFGDSLAQRISQGEQVRLWSLDDDAWLCLGMNDCSYHEGLWALSLRDAQGRRLYYLSLCFLPDNTVLVPTLQGPADAGEDARQLIRQLTKKAEGLRPHALLMAALRSACRVWALQGLQGIDPQHHVKGRWNLRRSRLRFDYPAFWQEQGGTLGSNGLWQLPLRLPVRDQAEAPSNKRAMYRRRQALMDALDDALQQALGHRRQAQG